MQAVTALRHKPSHQSFDSYVLDLRARFLPKEMAVVEYEVWRKRALELERQLKEVEEKYQGERVELAALQAKVLSLEDAKLTKGQKKKAGQKKSSAVPHPTIDSLNATFNLDALQVPPLCEPHSVLSSLRNLEILAGPLGEDRKKLPSDAFVGACHRALDSFAAVLVSALRSSDRARTSTLDFIARLSPQFLSLVLPLLARSPRRKKGIPSETAPDCVAILDRFVGSLATSLLAPLVHAFFSSSDAFYAAALSDTPKKKKKKRDSKNKSSERRSAQQESPVLVPVDIRPYLSSLLESHVNALGESVCLSGCPGPTSNNAKLRLISVVADTVDFLTLETVRELESLYPDASSHTASAPPNLGKTAASGSLLEQLARKDALWYLCQTMHLLMGVRSRTRTTRGKGSSVAAPASVLEDPIYTGLSALLRRTAVVEEGRRGHVRREKGECGVGKGVMCEAEREMLLAVVEKYWLDVA